MPAGRSWLLKLQDLVNAGSLRGCDPNRVVLKKIVLSGYPVRVHKGKGVVRWMFHTAEDVRWFRPLGLWTKRGRHGHIKVGTLSQQEKQGGVCGVYGRQPASALSAMAAGFCQLRVI